MIAALRACAAAIAILALVDPVMAIRRHTPLPIDVLGTPGTAALQEIEARLRHLDGVALGTGQPAAAVVVVGEPAAGTTLPEGVPIAIVDPSLAAAPNVRIVRVSAPDSVMPGQVATVTVDVAGLGMGSQSSTVVLEQAGVSLAALEHRWTSDRETFRAALRYAPPLPGVIRLTARARPLPTETSARDNAADLLLAVTSRTLRILVHEPRPSWAAAFVRRALESDPAFDVSTMTEIVNAGARTKQRPTVSAGAPPGRLSSETLEPFDAVVVGAPDMLAEADVAALDTFARVRGGGVVLLPDRRPSGPYLSLLAARAFDEILLLSSTLGS